MYTNLNMYTCILIYSKDMGLMVYNYRKVVKGLGCMTIKGLGQRVSWALGLRVRLRLRIRDCHN